ncbi:GntR family transcriptional regulator [Yoonia sp. SS1-5]|uniref:GntR family transcriptional regulator n=1 Tax=Yoonia rhodophyticola TaxID=3137370 RepID=A0AAN0NIW8_9RHOB
MSTLYAQVCEKILDQIQNGALKVGDRLPPEADYAAELGISRSTLRLAFSELEAAGVLKRKKRAGTEIISDTPKPRFNMATSGIGELLSLGRDTEFTIFETRTCRTEDIEQLEGLFSETGHWLHVSGARSLASETRPFSVNQVFVPARFAAIEPLLTANKTSVYQAIEDTFSVAVGRVSQTVRAIACPAAEAKIMGLAENAPVLQIEAQLFVQDGSLMEVSVATFDPARFQVRTDVEIE